MEEFLTAIGNLGFPITVSIYLLVRVEKKLEVLANSINELARVIAEVKT